MAPSFHLGNDQEIKFLEIEIQKIKFQEIKINAFHEIETFAKLIRRLKLAFCKIVLEIEKALRALGP
jgi:hypothetical protein